MSRSPRFDVTDGRLEWDLRLAPGSAQVLEVRYAISAPSEVGVSFE